MNRRITRRVVSEQRKKRARKNLLRRWAQEATRWGFELKPLEFPTAIDFGRIYDALIVDGTIATRQKLTTAFRDAALKELRLSDVPDFAAIGKQVIAEDQGLLTRLTDA